MQIRSLASLSTSVTSKSCCMADDSQGFFSLVDLGSSDSNLNQSAICTYIFDEFTQLKELMLQSGKRQNSSIYDLKGVIEILLKKASLKYLSPDLSIGLVIITRDKILLASCGVINWYLIRGGQAIPLNLTTRLIGPNFKSGVNQDSLSDVLVFDLLASDIILLGNGVLLNLADQTRKTISSYNSGIECFNDLKRSSKEFAELALIMIEAVADSTNIANDLARVKEITAIMSTLKQMYLLNKLDYCQLLKIVSLAAVSEHGVGLPIILEGSAGDSIYIIIRGKVSVKRGEVELALLSAGDHFGEMALLSNAPRNASVYPLEPTKLLTIPGDDLRRLIGSDTSIGVNLLWQLSTELSKRLAFANSLLNQVDPSEEDTLRIELNILKSNSSKA